MAGVTALLMCAGPFTAEVWGQRTMRGESFVSAGVHTPFMSPYGWGASLSYGQYLLGAYWNAGLTATGYTFTRGDGLPSEYVHAGAFGEWMYRLAGTRSRALSVYAGGGAFIGYEAEDPWQRLSEWECPGFPDGSFLYGLWPAVELEIFPMRRLALVFTGRAPVNFTSPHGWLHLQAGAGIRLNL